MKRKEDSFEDIALELEKETSKSKFLPCFLYRKRLNLSNR